MEVICTFHVQAIFFCLPFSYLGILLLDDGFKSFYIFYINFIYNFVAKWDEYIVQQ